MPVLLPMIPRPRPSRAVAAVVVALGMVCGLVVHDPSQALAATPISTGPQLVMSVIRSNVGGTVTLRGRVLGMAGPLTKRGVEVQQRVRATGAWRTVERAIPNRAGHVVVITRPLSGSGDFRLRLRTASATTTSATQTVVIPTVSVTATSPLTPTAGEAVVLAGTTSTDLRGVRIHLQHLTGIGVWRTVSSSLVSADATFNVQAIATDGGDQSYRAVVQASGDRAFTATDPVQFTVSAWYRLSDLTAITPPHAADRLLAAGKQVVAGAAFEQSLSAPLEDGQSSGGAYALRGQCSIVRATVGSADGATGSARWRLLADDDVAVNETVAADGSTAVQAAISGAEVLELRAFQLAGAGSAVWGSPEVLCAGLP